MGGLFGVLDQSEPIQLIAGGSGIVPLMAMIRSRLAVGNSAQFKLLYSVREPAAVFYKDMLGAFPDRDRSVVVTYAFTRIAPKDWPRAPGRIDAALIAENIWPPGSLLLPAMCVALHHL